VKSSPTRPYLHIHLPPAPDGQDEHTELSAALADMLGRLDDPTRDGLRALAEREPLEAVAAEHGLTHAALRQRVTRARHRLQPQLAPFMRTVA
jgi:DNA-directed RNA polymerase specialized sigma24 family protein